MEDSAFETSLHPVAQGRHIGKRLRDGPETGDTDNIFGAAAPAALLRAPESGLRARARS